MNRKQLTISLALSCAVLLAALRFFAGKPFGSQFSYTSEPFIRQAVAAERKLDAKIPKAIYPCIAGFAKQVNLLASTSKNDHTYYLLLQQIPGSGSYKEFDLWKKSLIVTDKLGCLPYTPAEGIVQESLTQYVPKDVANQLALQNWKDQISKLGGKEKVVELLAPGEDTLLLNVEDVWALKQLGVKIPERHLKGYPLDYPVGGSEQ